MYKQKKRPVKWQRLKWTCKIKKREKEKLKIGFYQLNVKRKENAKNKRQNKYNKNQSSNFYWYFSF